MAPPSERAMENLRFHMSRWLEDNGAILLPLKQNYEAARFKANNQIFVVYWGSKGIRFSCPTAEAIYNAYKAGRKMSLNSMPPRISRDYHTLQNLLTRDGDRCFYCGAPFSDEDPETIEHLVPRCFNGPDHISNLVLAHEACNKRADNLSVAEKVWLRENWE